MEDNYRGIRIRAAGDVHRCVLDKLLEVAPPPCRVLDIASGNGALALRMQDAGYDVTASDGNPQPFEPDMPCIRIDLDRDVFSDELGGPFDAIVAVEVIEHLENPAAFLRACTGILAESGVLIVTSPNLDSATSRMRVLTRGMPSWFSPDEARNEHHVSPQLSWFMLEHARSAGLDVVDEWCTDPSIAVPWGEGWKTKLLYRPSVLRFVEKQFGAQGGDVRLWEMRHAAGRDVLAAPGVRHYWDEAGSG